MVLSEKILDDILNYLDDSVSNLAKDTLSSPEFQMETSDLKQFLSNQYDIRLGNLLQGKNSNVHHLESGMKKPASGGAMLRAGENSLLSGLFL